MRDLRIATVLALAAMLLTPVPSQSQDAAASAPNTVWRFLGIPQGIQRVRDVTMNRRGNRPELERKPPLKRIADPENLESENPAIKTAAEIKQAEDMKQQKIKAIKYLASIGCGCYDKEGKITEALLAATDDCTPDVRLSAIEAIEEAAGNECCRKCGSTSCCNEKITKRLSEIAYERDDSGCPIESSAEIRKAAQRVLRKCCPNGPPVGPIEEELPELETVPTPEGENEEEEEEKLQGESSDEDDRLKGETSGDEDDAATEDPLSNLSSTTATPVQPWSLHDNHYSNDLQLHQADHHVQVHTLKDVVIEEAVILQPSIEPKSWEEVSLVPVESSNRPSEPMTVRPLEVVEPVPAVAEPPVTEMPNTVIQSSMISKTRVDAQREEYIPQVSRMALSVPQAAPASAAKKAAVSPSSELIVGQIVSVNYDKREVIVAGTELSRVRPATAATIYRRGNQGVIEVSRIVATATTDSKITASVIDQATLGQIQIGDRAVWR